MKKQIMIHYIMYVYYLIKYMIMKLQNILVLRKKEFLKFQNHQNHQNHQNQISLKDAIRSLLSNYLI